MRGVCQDDTPYVTNLLPFAKATLTVVTETIGVLVHDKILIAEETIGINLAVG